MQLVYQYPEEAQKKLDGALARAPDLVEARVMMAYQRMLRGRRDEAGALARDILSDNPESAEAAVLLATVLRAETPAEAERLEKLAEGRLRDDRLFFYRAMLTQDDAEAEALLTRSLELPFDTSTDLLGGLREANDE